MAFEQTIARLKSYQDWMRIQQGLMIIVKEAQKRCPVDTGDLRKYWMIKASRGVYSIVFSMDYAIYVHENLYVHHPIGEAKFLENAWNVKKNEFLDFLYS